MVVVVVVVVVLVVETEADPVDWKSLLWDQDPKGPGRGLLALPHHLVFWCHALLKGA